jgi:hypothetical protein
MPKQSQMQQQTSGEAAKLVCELIKIAFRSACLSVELPLHEAFGHNYVKAGPMAIVVAFVFLQWFPDDDPRPLTVYLIVVIAFWVNALAQSILRKYWRRRPGEPPVHRKYTGWPFVMALVPGWQESTVKQLEGFLVVLLGLAVRHANVPLGDYLVGAAGILTLRNYCTAAGEREEAAALADAMIDQQLAGERFRKLQGS